MDKHALEKKREATIKEYYAKQRQAEVRLDELKTKRRAIESHLDDTYHFKVKTYEMLDRHRSELKRHGARREFEMIQSVIVVLHQDCRDVGSEFFDVLDEIEREQKKIHKENEDIEIEYRRTISALREGKTHES